MHNTEAVLFEKRGEAGIITLNRPKVLNAINLSMVRALQNQLNIWAHDNSITRVIVTGAGDKAFCAGGDLRSLHEFGKQGCFDKVLQFFREEFRLIHTIKTFPKPYISLMDGIVMGGGFGLSAHGSYRIAGDRYAFAMPEVSIGFFPDVGATYVLPRLPKHFGKYIALTGEKIGAWDALDSGLLTHVSQTLHMNDIIAEISVGKDIGYVLNRYSNVSRPFQQSENLLQSKNCADMDFCFGQSTLLEVMAKLDACASSGSGLAKKTADIMRSKSPTSMAIVHEQMERGRYLSFNDALKLEFCIVSRIIHSFDFFEGIRAAIIDKDQKPAWTPSRIEDISRADIKGYFHLSPHNELFFT